jgi:hypothetical protein
MFLREVTRKQLKEEGCRRGRWNGRAPEAEHVAPSASLHTFTSADRREGQGGWAAEALTLSTTRRYAFCAMPAE